jgi:hypothetical protein
MYSTGAAADAILLRVDDTYCAITVGNSGTLKANGFTWVNFQDGDVANFIDVRLTAGNHAITMAGVEAGVGVDRLLFLTDKNCVPEGTGDNCGDETDVIALPFSGLANNGTVQQVEEAIPKHKVNVGGMIAAGAVALTLVALGVGWYGWRHNWQWPKLRKGGK